MMTGQPLLDITGLTRRYPGVTALDGVSLTMTAGTVHALVGENGAGKSTLIKILAGVVRPDEGAIRLDGQPVTLDSPDAARRAGIAVVHQHTHLIPDLTVGENYALRQGYPRSPLGTIGWGKIRRLAAEALNRLIPTVSVDRDARTLSGVEKQMVELAFGLASSPRILILDEPTAVLPHAETERLFQGVREYVAGGGAVLFVSHRLDEIFTLASEVTVLRDGRLVWNKAIGETDHDDLIRAMVGRSVSFERDPESVPGTEVRLAVEGLRDRDGAFEEISFRVRRGEIYGIYGLVGAGQSELCHALFGLRPGATGECRLGDTVLRDQPPGRRVDSGIGYVPADRLSQGMFHQMTVGENMSITALDRKTRLGWVNRAAERGDNESYIRNLRVKTLGPEQRALQLSGGNQQKVLLGRWLQTDPEVLILEEPTQGVDVGAKGEIHRIITGLARAGKSVVLVTSEIPELLALSHRVGVMREGRLVAELDAAATTEDELLRHALPDAESKKTDRDGGRKGDRASAGLSPAAVLRWLTSRREAGLAFFLAVLAAVLAARVPAFGTVGNLQDILVNQSILMIGALGMMLVIISGGIDISVGAILALAALAAARADAAGWPLPLIAGGAMLAGLALGALNGALTVFGRVHSIVITLGTLSIFRAAAIELTGDRWPVLSERVTSVGRGKIGGPDGVPLLIIAAGAAALAVHLLLRHAVSGRRLYAFGGDKASAAFLGITDRRTVPLAFAVSGLLMGLAGALHASFYGQVQSNTGQGFELKVIAAAVIGGTHIMGGRGSVAGTLMGALFLGVVSNALVLTRVSTYWDDVVLGSMILLAILVDTFATRRRGALE